MSISFTSGGNFLSPAASHLLMFPTRTALFVVLGGLLWLLPSPPAAGQDPPPLIRARVDVVNILCTVQDRKGRYVKDLRKEDFEVLEDGVPQKLEYFAFESGPDAQPLTIALLIDTSGSVKEKLDFEQQAGAIFLKETLRPQKDMAAVLQFDSEVNLVQDFTFDFSRLEDAILEVRAGGATKLYDALWLAAEEVLGKEVGRKVMVVLSDGEDTQSMVTEDEAMRAVQERDIVVYGIGVQAPGFGSNFDALRRFATATGGRFFKSRADLRRLREAFGKINQEIKHQYSLGYHSNRPRDGSFREIRVRLRRPGLKVNHRKGYYAPRTGS